MTANIHGFYSAEWKSRERGMMNRINWIRWSLNETDWYSDEY